MSDQPTTTDPTPTADPTLFDLGRRSAGSGTKWRHRPQQTKLSLLVLLAMALGLLIGSIEQAMGHLVWPLLAAAGLAAIGLVALVHQTTAMPLQTLLHQVERLATARQAGSLKQLPTDRGDELGQLARALHNLAAMGRRDHHEVNRLQRNLADHVEQATRRETSHLRQMAWCDQLTGLANRRYLDQNLPAQIDQCKGHGIALVCVMMDLDHFKEVNDTQGHAVGDEILKLIGKLIRGSIRKTDMGVRFGGDEFALILPGGTVELADQLVHSLRKLLKRHMRTVHPEAPMVDLSAGIALLSEVDPNHQAADEHNDLPSALLACADQRLYSAKYAGKAQTTTPFCRIEHPDSADNTAKSKSKNQVTSTRRQSNQAGPAHKPAQPRADKDAPREAYPTM